jgi:hypothetical protein
MILWTIVLKGMGRVDSGGEYPYQVRAVDRFEAMTKARAIHKERHPDFNHCRVKVKQVVEWDYSLVG